MKIVKVLFLCVFIILNFSLLKAQTSQGNILLGISTNLAMPGTETGPNPISLGYSTETIKSNTYPDNSYKTVGFNLLPKVGYFVIKNLAFGLNLSLNISESKESSGYSNQVSFSAGPFVRYYMPIHKFLPFIELEGSLGTMKDKGVYSVIPSFDSSTDFSAYGGGLGMTVPIGNVAAFDVMLDYSTLTYKERDDNPDNVRTIIGTVGVKLGFVVFLHTK